MNLLKENVVKKTFLSLFHHVITTIQLNFINSEIKRITRYASSGTQTYCEFEATEYLRNRMRKEKCRERL